MTRAFCHFAPYSLAFFMTLLSVCGFLYGGLGFFAGLVIFFGLHPLLDNFIFKNLSIKKTTDLNDSFWADLYLWIAPLILTSILFWAFLNANSLKLFELIGLILSSGAISATLGINIAHELVHRREKYMRAIGVYLLMTCHFAHWGISHVMGHHKNVGTLQDSATARKNETVYAFWLRAYGGGLCEAIQIENKKKLLIQHRVLWYFFVSLLTSLGVFFLFGGTALIFWWGQSLIAILLLETIDYIEHYGLTREKKLETGLHEAFKAKHSWDSSKALTNYALINLGLHSSHHLKANLHYPKLEEQPAASQLPYGYSLMALIALIPPLYFRIINSRIQ